MRIALAAFAALSLAGQARAAGEEYRSCAIKAYGIDQDVKGMNVRAAPSAQARIVRVVSNYVAGETTITGYRAGWFRVSKVLTAEEDTVLFRGDGWVHASLLHLDVAAGDPTLYSGPSRKARVLKKLTGDQPGITLVACKGDWAQVRVGGTLGWLSPGGQCSNPLTTCA